MIQDIAQIATTLKVVLDLAECLTGLVSDSIGAFRRRFKFRQIRKELAICGVTGIIADQCVVTVERTVCFRGSPISLSVLRAKHSRVLFAREAGRRFPICF